VPAALLLSLVAVALAGCWVVPAPPPSEGLPPPPPPFVTSTPQCGWTYGPGWYGWGWYGNC
jgi:hypothetical protein